MLASPFYDDNSYMEKAKYYFQQSLDMRKEFYGLEHPEVAALRMLVASTV